MSSWNQNPNKKVNMIRFSVIIGIAIVAVPMLFFLFPHALNKQWLVDIKYFESNEKQRVLTIYKEIANSEDGDYLKGYWLYLLDPATNKELSKIFIKRSNDDIPQDPETYFFGEKELWLIGRTGFASGEKPFQTIVEIKDDKFSISSTDFLSGWTLQAVNGHFIGLLNQYNEQGCLDVFSRKISDGPCPYLESDSVPPVQTCFFFAKHTPTSTRNHLYYYQTSTIFPPAGIFSGYLPDDGTIPGWHLMDAVSMNRVTMDMGLVNAYKSKFDTSEHLTIIQEKTLFNNPIMLGNNDSICTFMSANDDGKTYTFYQANSSGKMLWQTPSPKIKTSTSTYDFRATYNPKETIIIHPNNWVLCINNADGAVKWKCPK